MKKILIALSMLLFTYAATAQGQFDLNIGTAKTDLKKYALRFAVNYAGDFFGKVSESQINSKRSFVVILPEFTSEEGSKDAFSSITAKVTGFWTFFKLKKVADIDIPDLQRTFHVIPFSAGVETNGDFEFVNGIFEAGYFPWYYQPTNPGVPEILKYTKTGIFLQLGYKFKLDSTKVTAGGAKDQSKETINSEIFRTRFVFQIDTKDLLRDKTTGFGIGVSGGTNLWYDLANGAFYHRIEGKARLHFNKTYHFDLDYANGSGAPNFNQGDQFGFTLGVSF
jgi:hypothetical protein